MRINVEKLRTTLKLLAPVIPTKAARGKVVTNTTTKKGGRGRKKETTTQTSMPILEHVLLKDGKAMATNFGAAVSVEMEGAVGECLLPHRAVVDMLNYVPGSEMVDIEQKDKELTLRWETGGATLETMDPGEFPAMPQIETQIETVVDGDTLIPAMLSMTNYCADVGDNKPVLSGVFLFLGDPVELGGADGFRLAYKKLPNVSIPPLDGLKHVIIPANTVVLLEHLWSTSPRSTAPETDSIVALVTVRGKMNVSIGNKLQVKFGKVTMTASTIAGTPPGLTQLIPKDPPLTVQLFAPDLERAIRSSKTMAKEGQGIVRMEWDEHSMKVTALAGDKGKVSNVIAVNADGGVGRIGLNLPYLMEYLKGKTGFITMATTDHTKPALFRCSGHPLVVIMPMHVDWGTEQAVVPTQ